MQEFEPPRDARAAEYREIAAEFDGLELVPLIQKQADLRIEKDRLEAELSEINKRYDFCRKVAVPGKFEEQGIKTIKVAGVGRVHLKADLLVRILPGKKDDAYQYLRDTGRGDLIAESVNASTLKAACRRAFEDGDVWPDDVFGQVPETVAVITKG